MTRAERKLWRCLRELPIDGTHFRRQAPVGPYFADFACHRYRLIVELDGGQHNETTQARRDASRTAYLKAHGYRVLRFWNNEVLENIEGVYLTIHKLRCAGTPRPPPLTPPQAGGGEPRFVAVNRQGNKGDQ
jgi:very-short-patch-repair endonuclease